jgi:hypothetical protein
MYIYLHFGVHISAISFERKYIAYYLSIYGRHVMLKWQHFFKGLEDIVDFYPT